MSARRWWAWPLVPVYAAVLAVKDGLRAVGVLKVRSLGWPVVSVGSLSAGGAGKTPVVIALAKLLRKRGWNVDVLTRGYGRDGVGVERVDGDDDAKRFGDEPVLIARAANVPVWVGADRFAAGMRAEAVVARGGEAGPATAAKDNFKQRDDAGGGDRGVGGNDRRKGDNAGWSGDDRRSGNDRRRSDDGRGDSSRSGERRGDDDRRSGNDRRGEAARSGRGVHLLDDGLQHRKLARAIEVVLITAEDLNDVLLPAGNLREPLRTLRRADIVVIRQEEWKYVSTRVREMLGRGTPLWSVDRTLRFPAPLGVLSAGLRPVAFCAIARPEGFAGMLHEAGCGVVETVAFGDHHAYSMAGIEHIVRVAKGLRASGFVTTEKDAVKLSPEMCELLETVGPVAVVAMEAEFLNSAEVVSELEDRLG